MGCCSSVPSHDDDDKNKKSSAQKSTKADSKSSASHAAAVDNNNKPEKTTESQNQTETWPIFVRLSSNGKDITVQAPIHPPYLTVAELRQKLLPDFEKKAKVKLIYLGRILSDQHIIIPTETDDDTPLPPPQKKLIQIQKEGVIQAMIIA